MQHIIYSMQFKVVGHAGLRVLARMALPVGRNVVVGNEIRRICPLHSSNGFAGLLVEGGLISPLLARFEQTPDRVFRP